MALTVFKHTIRYFADGPLKLGLSVAFLYLHWGYVFGEEEHRHKVMSLSHHAILCTINMTFHCWYWLWLPGRGNVVGFPILKLLITNFCCWGIIQRNLTKVNLLAESSGIENCQETTDIFPLGTIGLSPSLLWVFSSFSLSLWFLLAGEILMLNNSIFWFHCSLLSSLLSTWLLATFPMNLSPFPGQGLTAAASHLLLVYFPCCSSWCQSLS